MFILLCLYYCFIVPFCWAHVSAGLPAFVSCCFFSFSANKFDLIDSRSADRKHRRVDLTIKCIKTLLGQYNNVSQLFVAYVMRISAPVFAHFCLTRGKSDHFA